MIGSIRQDDSTACMTVEGALNSEVLRSYGKEIHLATLKPGDSLVMDHLSAHKDRQALDLPEVCAGRLNSPSTSGIERNWWRKESDRQHWNDSSS